LAENIQDSNTQRRALSTSKLYHLSNKKSTYFATSINF
jgi:hypothetical protein